VAWLASLAWRRASAARARITRSTRALSSTAFRGNRRRLS
jgi:hypothetical protein